MRNVIGLANVHAGTFQSYMILDQDPIMKYGDVSRAFNRTVRFKLWSHEYGIVGLPLSGGS